MTKTIFICCDCDIWSEERPEKCICGSHCFTEENVSIDKECGLCGNKAYLQQNGIMRCDTCGARETEEGWAFICVTCNQKVLELEGLFVPHNCHECQTKEREKQIKRGAICSLCRKPYVDCYC